MVTKLVTCVAKDQHSGIHRMDDEAGGPACKTSSWGARHKVAGTVGTARDSSASAARDALVDLGLPVCRMCRRCWPGAQIPAHDRRMCFVARTEGEEA